MRRDQYKSICEWQRKVFTKATPLSCAKHLREEVQELIDNLELGSDIKYEEIADCFLLLVGVCNMMNINYDTLTAIIDNKMIINRKRKWQETEGGYMKHIPEKQEEPKRFHFDERLGFGIQVPTAWDEREVEVYILKVIDRAKKLKRKKNEDNS